MTKRVLVLGSSGFIGRHVVEALAKSDWATTVAAVRENVSRENEGRVEYVSCDASLLRLARSRSLRISAGLRRNVLGRCVKAFKQR